MTTNLIVNPYIQMHYHQGSEIVFTAPKPGDSLRDLTISVNDHKNVFDVFSELAQVNLNFLDIDASFSAEERDLLIENGILVEKENQPQLPLFACLLEEVSPASGEIEISSLIVNPTFRFQPFDLTKFASLVNEKHQSPYQPRASVVSPVSEIEIAYWLAPNESELVSVFEAGKKPQVPKDENFVRRLIESEILVTPKSQTNSAHKWNERINVAAEKYANDKYAIIAGLMPDAHMKAMRRFFRSYIAEGFMPFGDTQVEKRYRQQNEPLASVLHRSFRKLVSLVACEEVIPSYVFAAGYKNGAELVPHTDREQCEFSISFQVDYEPEQSDQMSPWALYVEPLAIAGELPTQGQSFGWNSIYSKENPTCVEVALASGDGLFYKGRELVHYRFALPEGHRSTSLFFHYVAADFSGSLN